MIMMTVMLTISVLTFTSRDSSSSDDLEASAGSGSSSRSSLGLGVGESFPLLSLAPVGALVEVALLVSSLGGLLAERPQLGSLILLLNSCLSADSFGVLPVLLLTCEDPLHVVL